MFFFCCFGSIQAAIFTLIVDRSPGAWTLRPDIATIAIIYAVHIVDFTSNFGALFSTSIYIHTLTDVASIYTCCRLYLGVCFVT